MRRRASLLSLLALILCSPLSVEAMPVDSPDVLTPKTAQHSDDLPSRSTLGREVNCKQKQNKRDQSRKTARNRKSQRSKCQGKLSSAQVPRVELNSYGCFGLSSNPHYSSTGASQGKSEIAAKARSECPGRRITTRLSAQAWVQRHNVMWQAEGTHPRQVVYNYWTVEAVAITRCDNDLYRTVGEHWVTIRGVAYFGFTSKEANVRCGR